MDPVSAVPEAGAAGIPAAPRTPASSPPFAGRSRTDVPPPAGSSPPHTPRAAPARTVPRLSSLRPLPILPEDLLLPDFCSGPAALSGRSMRDYLSGALSQGLIAKKGPPRWSRRCASWGHVARHGGFGDFETDHQKLAMDPWRASD